MNIISFIVFLAVCIALGIRTGLTERRVRSRAYKDGYNDGWLYGLAQGEVERKDCERAGYLRGEAERVALATANSELRSELRDRAADLVGKGA